MADFQFIHPLATQAQAIDAPGVQVMPIGVVRRTQPLSTNWKGVPTKIRPWLRLHRLRLAARIMNETRR